jgi:prefoldin subunit 4
MLAPEEENEAEVRREDQNAINQFARLNARKHALREEIRQFQQQLEHLEDASTELMMLDGGDNGGILLQLGEAYVECPEEEATEVCEQLVTQVQGKVDQLQQEEKELLEQQATLKALLYGRFGKSINLEES